MELHARIVTLEYLEPFVISRAADTKSQVVQVAITHAGLVGYGEGAPDERYDEGPSTPALDPRARGAVARRRPTRDRSDPRPGRRSSRARWRPSARVDGALHDSRGRSAASRCSASWGSTPRRRRRATRSRSTRSRAPPTGRGRAASYQALKIKVGGPGDLERVRGVRAGGARCPHPGRRERGVDGRRRRASSSRARRARRRAGRAAAPRRRPRRLRRAPRRRPADPDRLDESCHTLPDVAPAAGTPTGSTSSSPSPAASARRCA